LEKEKLHQDIVKYAIKQGLLKSCHDLSEGGLAIALSKAALDRGQGFEITTRLNSAQMFSETQSRFLVTVFPSKQEDFEKLIQGEFELLGQVSENPDFKVTTTNETVVIDGQGAANDWMEAMACLMK